MKELKQAIKSRGFSTKEIAELCEINQRNFYSVLNENQDRNQFLHTNHLKKIAKKLNAEIVFTTTGRVKVNLQDDYGESKSFS